MLAAYLYMTVGSKAKRETTPRMPIGSKAEREVRRNEARVPGPSVGESIPPRFLSLSLSLFSLVSFFLSLIQTAVGGVVSRVTKDRIQSDHEPVDESGGVRLKVQRRLVGKETWENFSSAVVKAQRERRLGSTIIPWAGPNQSQISTNRGQNGG